MWNVRDNVTGQTVNRFDQLKQAAWLCRGLNLQAGPGGRYTVRDDNGNLPPLRLEG